MATNAGTLEPVADVAELYAHLVELRREAAELYEEFAANMAFHNNSEAADLFAELGARARQQEQRARSASRRLKLPGLRPWEFKWPGNQSPAYIPFEELHYLMHRHHGLQLALQSERAVQQFFRQVARQSPDGPVRELAQQWWVEQRTSVESLEHQLRHCPAPSAGWDDDPEPPLIVE